MAVVGIERQSASTRGAEVAAFGRLAGLVNVGHYTAADVLGRLCTEVRSSFGYDGAAVLRHDSHAGTVLPVVRQCIYWPEDALAVSELPFVAAALTRREAVWPGEAPWLDAPVALPLLVADRCPAFVVADRPADTPDGEALHLLGALGSMAAVLLDCADHDRDVEDELAELQHIDRLKTDFLGI